MRALIVRLWLGEVPLAEAFWHYAVGYGLLLNLATSMLFLGLVLNEASAVLLVPAYLIPAPYNLLVTVAVWRGADRYPGPRKWAELARAATVIAMILLTAT